MGTAAVAAPSSATTAPSGRSRLRDCPRAPTASRCECRCSTADGGDARRAESASQYSAGAGADTRPEGADRARRPAGAGLAEVGGRAGGGREGRSRTGGERTDAGAPALRRRSRQQHRSDGRADAPGAGARQPDRGAVQPQHLARIDLRRRWAPSRNSSSTFEDDHDEANHSPFCL